VWRSCRGRAFRLRESDPAESATISTKIVFNEREYASLSRCRQRAPALRRCDEAGARHRRDRSRRNDASAGLLTPDNGGW